MMSGRDSTMLPKWAHNHLEVVCMQTLLLWFLIAWTTIVSPDRCHILRYVVRHTQHQHSQKTQALTHSDTLVAQEQRGQSRRQPRIGTGWHCIWWQGQHHTPKINIFPTATLRKPYGNPTELQDFKHPMSLQAYLCVMGVNLTVHIYPPAPR